MLASTLPENGFQVDSMSDAYASGADEQGASGSAADSDGDSVADETASRGSQSSEAYTITNDVSLMALLSSKTTELTDHKNRSSSVLDTVPSTSTASTNNYDESDYAIATSDDQRSVTSQKEPFVEEARTTLEQRPPDSISPWMRNAGRKKSHPVWEFFKDLRAPDGTGGVICLHCDWRGDDRSPNNLKTHLKRFHEHDGVYKQFAARLAATPTQPYVKRNRPTSYSPNTTTTSSTTDLFLNTSSSKLNSSSTNGCLAAVRAALAGQQKNAVDDKKTMNFLAMIPRSSEVINITAGFSGEEDTIAANNNECNRNNDENGDDCGNDLLPRAADTLSMDGSSTSSTTNNNTNANNNNSHNGNSNSNANHLSAAALLSAAASNPFMYMAAANAISSVNGMNSTNKLSSSFSLMDSECVLTLMRVAAELDCTFLFHCRDGQAHFCFEANDTAVERLRGPELSLVDLGNEVKITECNGGIEIESETWKKTDWTQFTWAIRGKCQKVLLKR